MPRSPEVIRRRPNRQPLDTRIAAIVARFAALSGAPAKRFAESQGPIYVPHYDTTGAHGVTVGNVHFLPVAPRKSTSAEIHAVRIAETRRGRPTRTP